MALPLPNDSTTQEWERKLQQFGDIQAEIVQVILPKGKPYKEQSIVMNLESDYVQLGDENSISNVDFDTHDKAISDFLSSGPTCADNSRTVLRVLRRKNVDAIDSETFSLPSEGNKTERINIRAKLVQFIPPSEECEQNNSKTPANLALNLKKVVHAAQVGNKNQIYLSSQPTKSADFASDRPCLRVTQKPKSPLLRTRGKRFPVELILCNKDSHLEQSRRYNIEVDVTCDAKNREKEVTHACQWETDSESASGVTRFWFRFHEQNAKYELKFSLWENPSLSEQDQKSERKLLDEITVPVETGAVKSRGSSSKTTKKNHHSSKNAKGLSTEDPTTSSFLLLSVAEVAELCERFDEIMQILLPLRDDGEWEKFDSKVDSLLQLYTDVNTQVVIFLEQAVAASYRNEMSRAEKIFRKTWSLINGTSTALTPLLKGRALYYLAGIRRRAEKLCDAEELVRSSSKFLKGTDFLLDQALLAYEEGSLQLCFMGTTPCALKQRFFAEAKEKFERCFKLSEQLNEREHDIYNLKHQFTVMKKAMLFLDCNTNSCREKCVNENNIKEATRCLDGIQKLVRSKLAQAHYALVRADQFVRLHNYKAAESLSLEAWNLARTYGFDTLEAAGQRLQYIREIRSRTLNCR